MGIVSRLYRPHHVWSASIGSSPPRSRHEVVDWTGVRHHRGSSLQRSARSALSPELCALRPCPTPLLRDRLHPVNPSDEHRDVVHGAEPAKRAGRVGKAWVSGWRGAGGRCTRTSTSRAWSARSASSARSAQRLARAARKDSREQRAKTRASSAQRGPRGRWQLRCTHSSARLTRAFAAASARCRCHSTAHAVCAGSAEAAERASCSSMERGGCRDLDGCEPPDCEP